MASSFGVNTGFVYVSLQILQFVQIVFFFLEINFHFINLNPPHWVPIKNESAKFSNDRRSTREKLHEICLNVSIRRHGNFIQFLLNNWKTFN